MAILRPGRVGRFNGKIGDVVVSRWRDLTVGRSAPTPSTKERTPAQLDQQMRFGLVTTFFNIMAPIVNLGYTSRKNLSPVNAAVQDQINSVITGVYPAYQLDFPNVMLTKPKNAIDGGNRLTLTALADAQVSLTWVMRSRVGQEQFSDPKDKLNIVFYSATNGKRVFYLKSAERSAESAVFDMPFSLVGNLFHAYLYFSSVDGKSVSNSEYAGSFTLLE